MAAKINMRLDKNEMPSQDPNVRNKNFLEVALGYTEEQALDEAARCLNCKNHPCVSGCPVQVKIPEFIKKITEKDYEGAYQVIHETSSLPAVCGRVCPQETQCEGACVLGVKGEPVAIGKLERYVGDWKLEHAGEQAPATAPRNGHKVAVIGSGPAGLACASDLAKAGYTVKIFEALHKVGGVLVYGIPEFRLPKERIVAREIEEVRRLGVEIETDVIVGRTVTINSLMDEEGNQSEYKIVACAEMDGTEYMALEPIIEDPEEALMDAAELVFLKVSEELDEDGEAYLDAILDEDELDRVAEIFRDKLSEEYEFLDEDEEE